MIDTRSPELVVVSLIPALCPQMSANLDLPGGRTRASAASDGKEERVPALRSRKGSRDEKEARALTIKGEYNYQVLPPGSI